MHSPGPRPGPGSRQPSPAAASRRVARLVRQLRPYQREIVRAIVRSVLGRKGLTFAVEIARQGGKNEVSALVEMWLLARFALEGGTIVKAAPTLRPQARNSLRRLREVADRARLSVTVQGDSVSYGAARVLFLSAAPSANVVGMTADRLLEIDESQDIDPAKYDRDFRPMAASANATTVHYGTAWTATSLLERVKADARAAQARDGVPRVFRVPWQEVAAVVPDYGAYVAAERERLGADHPLFLTQYALEPLDRGGRLFPQALLDLLAWQGGDPAALPQPGVRHVAGLDLAGADPGGDGGSLGARAGTRDRDRVVLTIARVDGDEAAGPAGDGPRLAVVRWYAWQGEATEPLLARLAGLLRDTWRVQRLAVDATGLGQPIAALLSAALGPRVVLPVVFSRRRKSELGFGLLAAAGRSRLRVPAPRPGWPEANACWEELRLARRQAGSGQYLEFFVDPAEGHDDYLVSLALVVAAGDDLPPPRRARGSAGS